MGRWGTEEGSAYFSGAGSRGDAATMYIEKMLPILRDLERVAAKPLTIVDLGCGDFDVGRRLLQALPGWQYIGCDIVPELVAHHQAMFGDGRISFQAVDLVTDRLPQGDVGMLRQVLQHLSNADISQFLRRSPYPDLFVTEGRPERRTGPVNPDKLPGPHVRFDWATGVGGGVELDQPPFDCDVKELFSVSMPGHEIIATYRVNQKTGVPSR